MKATRTTNKYIKNIIDIVGNKLLKKHKLTSLQTIVYWKKKDTCYCLTLKFMDKEENLLLENSFCEVSQNKTVRQALEFYKNEWIYN